MKVNMLQASYLGCKRERKKGTKIDYIPLDEEGKITVENFKRVLTDKVKVVAIAMVSNVLGFVAPVKEIARLS